ncbi:MAG: NAD(P)H-hydrate dehydratase [Thermoflexales bacterium]|nr:NAD(P)H-hydrate dehydratase [Thermoflexales bacterium]
MNLLTVAEMREVERAADAAGLSFAEMLANAGAAAAAEIWGRLSDEATRIVVLCGPGNNGGDGLVCADRLAESVAAAGRKLLVQVCLLRPRDAADPLLPPLSAAGVSVLSLDGEGAQRDLRAALLKADVIVDALLGTGVSRQVDGPLRDVLREVAQSRERGRRGRRPSRLRGAEFSPALVALDGPTGMGYDTGSLDSAAVPADLTITFHAAKRGHFCYPAAGARGELIVAKIGIERLASGEGTTGAALRAALRPPLSVAVLSDAEVADRLPSRRPDANKGSHGRVLIVGGSSDYIGAPALAAAAALRGGAGLVTLAVPDALRPTLAALVPEAVYAPATLAGLEKVAGLNAALIGPGLGRADGGRAALGAFLTAMAAMKTRLNGCVFDADALNLLSEDEALIEYRLSALPSVLTPHAGEMARLTGLPVDEVQGDRIGVASRFAKEWRATVVLKGANTVVAATDGRAWVLDSANPALASAGTGDVLAGLIAGLMGQGLRPLDAALAGAAMHARAGEMWRAANGDAGLLASDLLPLLPRARAAIAAMMP